MDETQKRINKDLILRERLAIERTDMAIDRTLLSFIRTALYFAIAGMTIHGFMRDRFGGWVVLLFGILATLILLAGIYKYRQQKRKLKDNEKHIGDYKLEWEDDVE
ncbi:DUF202 domain-containing protein [Flavihumibacter rivuli]|uniref:DUF202 domain-containing protein n=1 Tax=Flavihumibacter rivuli TaxID=2838156 RepID=UPI001BDE21DF|nr:DUF202 domain-containing protein [Flavihumibacter rivuli]ULQ56056.1 DUF202 domain-containing protein [Flavihumibacter rivuli]